MFPRSCTRIIEMDDFGKGYSSLCALKDMPIDVLKLDGDFLSIEDSSSRCGKIITSVVNMAHSIDMPVIAEGVETKEEADFLKTIGCRFMQGYLFSKPLSAEELEETFLADGSRGFEMNDFKGVQRCDGMDFFDLDSQNTLIFNSYVGGAAIITRSHNLVAQVVQTIVCQCFEVGGTRHYRLFRFFIE